MAPTPQPKWLVGVESRLLDRISAAVLVTSLDATVLYANPFCEVLYGRSPAELTGAPATSFAAEPLEDSTLAEIGAALTSGQSWEGDFRVVRKDGSIVEVHAIDTPLFDDAGTIAGVVSLAFDVTRRRQMEQLLSEQASLAESIRSVGEALMTRLSPGQVVETITQAALDLTEAPLARYASGAEFDALIVEPGLIGHDITGQNGPGQEGTALDVIGFDDVTRDEPTAALARWLDAGSTASCRTAALAVVRSVDGDPIGAIVIGSDAWRPFAPTDRQVLAGLASQMGIALHNAEVHAAARHEIGFRRQAEAAQRFLAETSTMLALSFELPESFEHLAQLSVPFLGDLCLVDVADESGIRRVAAVHADPSKQDLVRRLEQQFPPDPAGVHPAASVVRDGHSEYSPDMTDAFLRTTTRDDAHFEIVRALDFTSYLCVPLTARGRILGALTLVSSGSGRRYTADDLALAEEFARRAGLVLDNARLYSERDHVARALQASLLPPSLPRIPGVQIAARYLAAGEGNEVGGDFYDVFQVHRNSWCLLVGDVAGKGPEAAAVAGLARHTLRAAAILARRPTQMLRTLHEAMQHDEASADRFCTVCCGLLRRTDTGAEIQLSCGGHPLPFVARADGSVEHLDCRGTLLGLADPIRLQDKSVRLEPGDAVVLYTDGAIEAHRTADDLFGEERLGELIRANASLPANDIADRILSAVVAFGPAEPSDDIAILVLKVDS